LRIPARTIFASLLLTLIGVGHAHAQGQSCDLDDSRQLYFVGGGAVVYVGGPIWKCSDGTTITADSAVYVASTRRVDFIRNVRFNEAERTLTSDYAQYIGSERRLMAQQNVVLTNKEDGTTVRGLALDYLQESPNNPQSRIDVHGGRPRATMYRKNDSTAVIDTTVIDADRMQIVGENVFKGWGSVEVTRGSMKTRSAYAEFDQEGSYMRLYGAARVESDSMTLTGDSIDAEMANGDEFKAVHARRNARLESKNSNVAAPRVSVTFDKGEVVQLVAVGGKRAFESAPQAVSSSADFTLTADSIDAKTPMQRVEQIIAVGNALGEKAPDSLDAKLPAMIQKDWVRGDTVQAFFTRDTTSVANADTAQVLERILAKGAPAASTYRLRENANDSTEISVNYLTAKLIDVVFKAGEVDHVHAQGDLRGIYLQPPSRATANATPGTQ
jgi:hypothetical protein